MKNFFVAHNISGQQMLSQKQILLLKISNIINTFNIQRNLCFQMHFKVLKWICAALYGWVFTDLLIVLPSLCGKFEELRAGAGHLNLTISEGCLLNQVHLGKGLLTYSWLTWHKEVYWELGALLFITETPCQKHRLGKFRTSILNTVSGLIMGRLLNTFKIKIGLMINIKENKVKRTECFLKKTKIFNIHTQNKK